ncbi:hypothetical protein B484DRAFT_162644 [Ochromonadaceae sp. CCMP2298]|nr:hypothetical protein B484DRAFT_162644 [Ochromonadaceae sp. CCMP2298]
MDEATLFGPGVANVWKRKRKQRTGLTAGRTLPPELTLKLGEAELFFINGDNSRAIELLSEVSMQAPKLPEPYSIMALIYESSGDMLRALQFILHRITDIIIP